MPIGGLDEAITLLNGSIWRFATSDPTASSPGDISDVTLNTTTSEIFQKQIDGTWESQGFITSSQYKGTFDASAGVPTAPTIKAGCFWIANVAGTITGIGGNDNIEVGDMVIALVDSASAAADFTAIQTNIDPNDFASASALATLQTQVNTNTTDIGTNASAITTNANNISTNTTNIATNTSNISTNTTNITNLQNDKADKTTTLTAGSGLSGGGDLSTNRTFDVNTAKSVTIDSDNVELVNDSASPGNDQFYGSNGSGTKGWFSFFSKVLATVLTGLSTATNAPITAADTVLSALGKLQAQISAIVIPVFGQNFLEVSSLGLSSTNSETYQNKLTLTSASVPVGKYRIGWTYSWSHGATNSDFEARILYNTSTQIMAHAQEPQDSGTDQLHRHSGFEYVDVTTAGVQTFELEYRTDDSDDTAYIQRARLEFWRVS